MRRGSKLLVSAIAVGATVAAVTGVGAAGAQSAAGPIGPNQTFAGLVNGHTGRAKVDVYCPGPVRINQTGHPISGQTIGVESPSPSTVGGFTGSAADSIVATLAPTSAGTAPLSTIFTQYGSMPLPTTIVLPCHGTAKVVYTPAPTSPTARDATVRVTFVAVCPQVCPLDSARQHAQTDGTIAGELGYEGGAYPGRFHPTAGLVRIAGPKLTQTIDVGPSGKFSAVEPPAKYTLVGCGGTDDAQCGPTVPVTVKAGKTVHVKVPWALVP